jgi:hypothetical protein
MWCVGRIAGCDPPAVHRERLATNPMRGPCKATGTHLPAQHAATPTSDEPNAGIRSVRSSQPSASAVLEPQPWEC